MNELKVPEKLKNQLRTIMRNHDLAKFGDAVTNFVYSLAKTNAFSIPHGERVFDKSLAEAVRNAKLRSFLPSSSSSGDLGDGAEALIGHAFLNKIITIDAMEEIIIKKMKAQTLEEISYRSNEKKLMAEVFEEILLEIIEKMK